VASALQESGLQEADTMQTLLDPFEIRNPEASDAPCFEVEVEVEVEVEPPALPPTRGPRVWVSEE
jgi:hypothetical protein